MPPLRIALRTFCLQDRCSTTEPKRLLFIKNKSEHK